MVSTTPLTCLTQTSHHCLLHTYEYLLDTLFANIAPWLDLSTNRVCAILPLVISLRAHRAGGDLVFVYHHSFISQSNPSIQDNFFYSYFNILLFVYEFLWVYGILLRAPFIDRSAHFVLIYAQSTACLFPYMSCICMFFPELMLAKGKSLGYQYVG